MKLILVLSLLLTSAFSTNASIVYQVERTIGQGTVTGFIETDGSLGILGDPNILDWEFTIYSPDLRNGPTTTINLASSQGHFIYGSALTATATQMKFDFNADQGSNSIDFIGVSSWCLNCYFNFPEQEFISFSASSVGFAEAEVRSGNQVIAEFTPVPLPPSIILLSSGFIVMFLSFARRIM